MSVKLKVFISYRRQDEAKLLAERLAEDLRKRGVDVFIDQHGIQPGNAWAKTLKDEIKGRPAMVVVGTASYFESEQCMAELDLALNKRQRVILPVMLDSREAITAVTGASGRQATLFASLRDFQSITLPGFPFDRAGYTAAVDKLEAALSPSGVGTAALAPYRGLLPFREVDADLFFGREKVAGRLAEKVRRRPLVCVLGASGSGKSSLVYAGLIPRLRAEGAVSVVAFRPGHKPFDELAAAFIPYLHPNAPAVESARRVTEIAATARTGGLRFLLRDVSSSAGTLLLFIDQFEELFTLGSDATAQREFLDQLVEVARAAANDRQVRVVLTLRGDCYGFVLNHRGFAELVEESTVLLSPMQKDEVLAAVEQPASKHGAKFEPGLVERILADAGDGYGNLPLLEFALTRLWERSDKAVLTLAGYEAIGGLSGCIVQQAESEYDNLTPEQQQQARIVLTSLVVIGDAAQGVQDARRRVPLPDLLAHPLVQRAVAERVIDAFVRARLLTTDWDLDHPEPVVEVAHEAVFRTWDRLVDWLNSDRENLIWLSRLHTLQTAWEAAGQSDSLLLRGEVLKEAERGLTDPRNATSSAALREFVRRGAAQREREARLLADAQVELLLSARTADIGRVLKSIDLSVEWNRARLREVLAANPTGPNVWRVRLALMEAGEEPPAALLPAALAAPLDALLVLRQHLEDSAAALTDDLWRLSGDPAGPPAERLRAAFLLATAAPADPRWGDLAEVVVRTLLDGRLTEFGDWAAGFRPAREHFLAPLQGRVADEEVRDSIREVTALVLADWFGDHPKVIANLLATAPPPLHDLIFRTAVERNQAGATADHLQAVAAGGAGADASEGERVRVGQRRAVAAATLLRLPSPAGAIPLFEAAADDPEAVFQFVHSAKKYGVPAAELVNRLLGADSDLERYTYASALGEFAPAEVPADAFACALGTLADLHRTHPCSGVHGISGWLLKRWGEAELVAEVARTPLAPDPTGRRRWFVEAAGETMNTFVVFPPGEFVMGSPAGEKERRTDEVPHPVRLTRWLAVADREITRRDFQPFLATLPAGQFPDIGEWSNTPDHPLVGLTWFEAVAFSRWLTTRGGRGEADQCYTDGMGAAFDPTRPGYRLPTEAEWEYACRCGTRTAFNFGSDRQLVTVYGWVQSNAGPETHVAASLRPNVRGVYNSHGNVWEWCHDWRGQYPDELAIDPQGPTAGIQRCLRGGSWTLNLLFSRSACRNGHLPTNRNYYIGLRMIRTLSPNEIAAAHSSWPR